MDEAGASWKQLQAEGKISRWIWATRFGANMLEIGKLLNEAKTLVEHGEWLPWPRRHTALPARTAQQAAAAWADVKNATVVKRRACPPISGLVFFSSLT
jgi:hypothetical protein